MITTKLTRRKVLPVVVFLIVILVLFLSAQTVSAAEPAATTPKVDWLGCIASPFSCTVFGITYLVAIIGGLLISLGGWVLNTMLEFSKNIIASPSVILGFRMTLSLANLGFVLGIIVIAIATILRRQSYGIKQILWKLVVAAILVNFSMVIAGTILDFSASLTKYFINMNSPTIGNDFWKFTDNVAKAFAPQSLLEPSVNINGDDAALYRVALESCTKNPTAFVRMGLQSAESCARNSLALAASNNPSMADDFFKSVLSLLFTIIFTFITAFTLLAFAILMLIRYVTLSILIILMPLVWLAWIFPQFSSHWTKWWSTFLRWTFFAPFSMLFLSIAVMITTDRAAYLDVSSTTLGVSGASAAQALTAATGRGPGFLAQAAEQIIVLGLALGGLFAANSLSITGAKAAQGALEGGLKAGGVWMAKTGGRGALNLAARAIQPRQPRPTTPTKTLQPLPGPQPPAPGTQPQQPYLPGMTPPQQLPIQFPTQPPLPGPQPPAPGAQPGATPTTPGTPTPTQPPQAAARATPAAQPQSWLTKKRQGWATNLQTLSTHPAVQTPGFFAATYGGMKDGSGLFKKGKVKKWTCQNCQTPVYMGGNTGGKPANNFQCPNCAESTNSLRAAKQNQKYENWQ